MKSDTYYLSSLESKSFEQVRECSFFKRGKTDSGKCFIVSKIDPPVPPTDITGFKEINEVIFISRHEGHHLPPKGSLPCFVFICRPTAEKIDQDKIKKEDLSIMAWGELYETRHAAENHIF